MSKHGGHTGGLLRITPNGTPHGSVVELDGHDITGTVRGVTLRLDIEHRPSATLDVLLAEVASDTDQVQAYLPPDTHQLLLRLGWTPPTETPGGT